MKGGIRPSTDTEIEGMDLPEMGVLAYAEFLGSSPHLFQDVDGQKHVPVPVPVTDQEHSR
jgi:hypothetical protein